MTTANNYVTIILMDNDENLPNDKRMIAKYEDVFVPAGEKQEMMIMKLCMNQDVKGAIEKHNTVRAEVVNPKTLERTGKEVPLQAIEFEQVSIMTK